MKHFHYIFAGSGLSALLTVYRMVVSGNFSDKNILLIDTNSKEQNDRTWCFWENKSGEWDNIVHRQWDNALFANKEFQKTMVLSPYCYKMIRGEDFYRYVKEIILKQSNITFVQQQVLDYADDLQNVLVKTDAGNYTCTKLFSSIYNPTLPEKSKYPLLQQHFIGWFVKTENNVFSSDTVTFMDFSIAQKGNTRFMYVLPLSANEALVEYTLFSSELLAEEEYEKAIENYLHNLGAGEFEIIEKERGNIPMTSYPFWEQNTRNILHIGSAGGWTKASTGYTFKNAVKKSKALADFLLINDDLSSFQTKNRFWYYDLLLLDVLYYNNYKGSDVFSAMFQNAPPQLIFKFLDEETSLSEELRIISSCPTLPFIKALGRNLIPNQIRNYNIVYNSAAFLSGYFFVTLLL